MVLWVLLGGLAALGMLAFFYLRTGPVASGDERDTAPEAGGRRRSPAGGLVSTPERRGLVSFSPEVVQPPNPAPITPAPAPGDAGLVTEQISVVLRRQIPVRFDEPPRSWLGGLPMMPDHVPWPVAPDSEHPERGPTPMHFVAQVACADLPAELWGGLGPRSGWLLMFLNGRDMATYDNPGAVRVLHVTELGPERAPPPGTLPVHDELFTGPQYKFVRGPDEIPVRWRRWPVDLVTIPNRLIAAESVEGKELRPTILPDNFASILYEGAPVGEKVIHPPMRPPFSWRGALYVVDSIARVLSDPPRDHRDRQRERVLRPGWRESAIERIDAEIARLRESPVLARPAEAYADDAARERRARIEERLEALGASRAFLAAHGDVETLLAEMERSYEAYLDWYAAAAGRVAALRDAITAHELDTALELVDWQALRHQLDTDRQPYWAEVDGSAKRLDASLLDYARDGLSAAQVELAADYYVSPALGALVPDEVLADMEPHWRALYSNRPHRMGGMHDGLQSDPVEGPTRSLLLFQIATDMAMHWVWGDAGAHYLFIDAERLAAGDFTKLEAWFENH